MSDRKKPKITVNKIAYSLPLARELAINQGLIRPTAEEAAEREVWRRDYQRRYRQEWQVYLAAREALDGFDEATTRAVLDLHRLDEDRYPRCQGCDIDGYEAEPPEWPCRTVRVIAELNDVRLPAMSIHGEPEETP